MYMEPTWTNEMAMIEMRLKWRLSFLLPIMALAAARVYSLVSYTVIHILIHVYMGCIGLGC